MATTITAAVIAPVLREAAGRVAALPYTRVVRADVHHAIRQSSSQYDIAQAALVALTRHVRTATGMQLLTHWSKPLGRDEAAAELRAAAAAVQHSRRGEAL